VDNLFCDDCGLELYGDVCPNCSYRQEVEDEQEHKEALLSKEEQKISRNEFAQSCKETLVPAAMIALVAGFLAAGIIFPIAEKGGLGFHYLGAIVIGFLVSFVVFCLAWLFSTMIVVANNEDNKPKLNAPE
jgi:hypothetical protein